MEGRVLNRKRQNGAATRCLAIAAAAIGIAGCGDQTTKGTLHLTAWPPGLPPEYDSVEVTYYPYGQPVAVTRRIPAVRHGDTLITFAARRSDLQRLFALGRIGKGDTIGFKYEQHLRPRLVVRQSLKGLPEPLTDSVIEMSSYRDLMRSDCDWIRKNVAGVKPKAEIQFEKHWDEQSTQGERRMPFGKIAKKIDLPVSPDVGRIPGECVTNHCTSPLNPDSTL